MSMATAPPPPPPPPPPVQSSVSSSAVPLPPYLNAQLMMLSAVASAAPPSQPLQSAATASYAPALARMSMPSSSYLTGTDALLRDLSSAAAVKIEQEQKQQLQLQAVAAAAAAAAAVASTPSHLLQQHQQLSRHRRQSSGDDTSSTTTSTATNSALAAAISSTTTAVTSATTIEAAAESVAYEFEAPMAPEPMYRNFFSKFVFNVPVSATTGVCESDGVRLFIDGSIGYSGNATRAIDAPAEGGAALIFNCEVRNPMTNEIVEQCDKCFDYFSKLGYFKQNPHQAHRNLLVKNNDCVYVRKGAFAVVMKLMCCCAHHDVEHFNFFVEVINEQGLAVFRTVFAAVVKQWKKGATKVSPSTISLHAVEGE
jgi:hypothetical protein